MKPEPVWPAAGVEEVLWECNPREVVSRCERIRVSGPYLASLPSAIAAVPFPRLSAAILADADEILDALDTFAARPRRKRL